MIKLKLFVLLICIGLIFSACEDKEKLTEGSFLEISDVGSFSEFDDVEIDIKLTNPGAIVQLGVELLGGKAYDSKNDSTRSVTPNDKLDIVTGTEGVFKYKSTLESIGVGRAGDEIDLFFRGLNSAGEEIGGKTTVKVYNPVTISNVPVVYEEDEVKSFPYFVKTTSALVSKIIVERKVGFNNAWNEIATSPSGEAWNTGKDDIQINGIDFDAHDTVYYRVRAVSGHDTSMALTDIIISARKFSTESTDIQLKHTNSYNLVENSVSIADSAADVVFEVVNLNELSISSGNDARFVVSSAESYKNNNVVLARDEFDAGAILKVIPDVELNSVYTFKTVRSGKEYLGMFKITDLKRTNSDSTDYITLSYRLDL